MNFFKISNIFNLYESFTILTKYIRVLLESVIS